MVSSTKKPPASLRICTTRHLQTCKKIKKYCTIRDGEETIEVGLVGEIPLREYRRLIASNVSPMDSALGVKYSRDKGKVHRPAVHIRERLIACKKEALLFILRDLSRKIDFIEKGVIFCSGNNLNIHVIKVKIEAGSPIPSRLKLQEKETAKLGTHVITKGPYIGACINAKTNTENITIKTPLIEHPTPFVPFDTQTKKIAIPFQRLETKDRGTYTLYKVKTHVIFFDGETLKYDTEIYWAAESSYDIKTLGAKDKETVARRMEVSISKLLLKNL